MDTRSKIFLSCLAAPIIIPWLGGPIISTLLLSTSTLLVLRFLYHPDPLNFTDIVPST